MKIIDQRILIPASPQQVWHHVSDLSQNPSWQSDCEHVVFISSRQSGSGVRWRTSGGRRREYVLETTAWYDGLGYEYVFIDGMPFSDGRGRIRLQETPEGTIVQWTLSYEPRGFLAGLRTLGTQRRLERVIVESLRTLYQFLQAAGINRANFAPKSLLQDAPDVEARSKYTPRHPSIVAHHVESVFTEPPLKEEDTRPTVPVQEEKPPTASPVAAEASDDMLKRFGPPRTPPTTIPEMPEIPKSLPPAEDVAALGDSADLGAVKRTPAPPPVPGHKRQTRESAPVRVADEPARIKDQQAIAEAEGGLVDIEDTGKISVFDVFGLPKPSETQEIEPITGNPPPVPRGTSASGGVSSAADARRVGLRMRMRRRNVRVRRPG